MGPEVRHMSIDKGISILISCGRITINAGIAEDGNELSFVLPADVSSTMLALSSDEEVASVCRPIGMLLRMFLLTMIGSFYMNKTQEEVEETLEILSTGLHRINLAAMTAIQHRQQR